MSSKPATKVALTALGIVAMLAGAPLGGMLLAHESKQAEKQGVRPIAGAAPAEAAPPENELVGVLLPSQMANLTPRAPGKIVEILHKVGQAVAKDDVIVAFDLRERRHDLAIAEAQLRAARADAAATSADLAFARKRVARRNVTVDVGGEHIALVSGEEEAQARSEAESARAHAAASVAHIAEQEARVEQLRLAVETSEIRAPFDGVVSAINLEPGMTANPGDVVARIVGGHDLRVRIAVPEEDAARLGYRHARIVVDTRTLMADVDQVSPELEPASRAFFVEGNVHAGDVPGDDVLRKLVGRKVNVALER